MLHCIPQGVGSKTSNSFEQPHVVVRILFQVTRVDGDYAQHRVIFKKRQGSHRAKLDACLRVYVGEVQTGMELVYRTAICESESCYTFTRSYSTARKFLPVLPNYVPSCRVAFPRIAEISNPGIK